MSAADGPSDDELRRSFGLEPAVYTKVERGGRQLYVRIGRARVNPDGSLALDLYALPVSGVIEVRRADDRSGT